MVLKKGDSAWRMLEYNPNEVEWWFGLEPREVFYAVEGLSVPGCKPANYTQEQLGKLVYQSMVDYSITSLYCKAGIKRSELIWAWKQEGKHTNENSLYKTLIYKKGTIDEDSRALHKRYSWKDSKFSQVYSFVEKVNGMSFSAILVEFVHESEYFYFEVESILTPAGWRIIDDINVHSLRAENQAFIVNRKK